MKLINKVGSHQASYIAWHSAKALLKAYSSWNAGVINDPKILNQAFRLRGLVFGEKLKWIRADSENGDVDSYDKEAVHFGVIENNVLIAYGRLIPGNARFMLEREFELLVDGVHVMKGMHSGEISRLVISDQFRGTVAGEILQAVLYRTMYRWAVANGMRYWYVVVTQKYFAKLQKYFDFQQIGKKHCFEASNEPAMAALVDFRAAEDHVRENSLFFSIWYFGFKVGGPFAQKRISVPDPT